MAAVHSQAALNNAKANVAPDTSPSGTQPCPLQKRLRLGVFFDGTGNNKYTDVAGHHLSNVAKLLDPYLDASDDNFDRDKLYLIGVGAGGPPTVKGTEKRSAGRWGTVTVPVDKPDASQRWADLQSDVGTGDFGGGTGKGIKDRIQIAYRWVMERIGKHAAQPEKLIDVFGFSRGAATARTFTNVISQMEKKDTSLNTSVRFLGVFDTVASTGIAGDGWFHAVGLNLGLLSGKDYRLAYHPTARDEVRSNFPLSLLQNNDVPYAGVHCDVGGSYGEGKDTDEKKSNWLAGVPLWDMYGRAKEAGVEFTTTPAMPEVPKPLAPNDDAVNEFRKECDLYDGTSGEQVSGDAAAWRAKYIHDSTRESYSPGIGNSIKNGARMVDDTSSPPLGYDGDGMPIYKQIAKRSLITEPRRTMSSQPPDYSWKWW